MTNNLIKCFIFLLQLVTGTELDHKNVLKVVVL